MEHAVTRLTLASLALLTLLPGCKWLEKTSDWLDRLNTVKVDNPVMGPPPPRIAITDDRLTNGSTIVRAESGLEDSKKLSDVRPVDYQNRGLARDEELVGSSIVALVDGSPIFAADILEPYAKPLKNIEQHASPAEVQAARRTIIQRDLPGYIDNRMLVIALRKALKKEQLESLDKHLNDGFVKYAQKKCRDMGVNTPYELDQKLQKEFDASLAMLRTQFENSQMADAYREEKTAKAERPPTRAEMLEYYQKHIEEYSYPASVKWQQIEVSFGKWGGKRQAFDRFSLAVEALKAKEGKNFADVARKFSDGPKADQGGQWNWTRQGSLADKALDKALFTVPVGTISDPIVGEESFQLVKVNERKEAGRTQFYEVQDDIKSAIKKSRLRMSDEELIAELRAKTVVETIFDKQPQKGTDVLPFE
jgi:parvulin-like peptidyl-prolyl isomerase